MSTVINTPSAANDSSASGLITIVFATLVLIGLFFVFLVYILPILRNSQQPTTTPTANIKVEIPAPEPTPSPAP